MMKIKILVAGRYNDSTLTAIDCEVGQVLETHDWYGEELAARGKAEIVAGTANPTKIRMPARREVNTTSPKKNKTAAVVLPPNPFVAPVQQPLVAEGNAPAGEPAAVSDPGNSDQGNPQTVEGSEGSPQGTPPQPSPSDGEGAETTTAEGDGAGE